MTARAIGDLSALGAAGLLAALGCADPVHNGQVEALGAEAPGVSPGPLHRPGQPCLACHGGSGPASAQFSIGGTVYAVKGQTAPIGEVTVELTDSNMSHINVLTNTAGNFYISLNDWAPVAPIKVSLCYGATCPTTGPTTLTAAMGTHIGRDGSCADCHYDPPGAATPGRVYMAFSASDLDAGMGGGG